MSTSTSQVPVPAVRYLHAGSGHPVAACLLPDGVEFVVGEVDLVDVAAGTVSLAGGRALPDDYLVVVTGVVPRPDQTPGTLGEQWRKSIFDFYSLDGALALAKALEDSAGGRFSERSRSRPCSWWNGLTRTRRCLSPMTNVRSRFDLLVTIPLT